MAEPVLPQGAGATAAPAPRRLGAAAPPAVSGGFRLVVAPAWDRIGAAAAARAVRLGGRWPDGIAPHRVGRAASLTLVGQLGTPADRVDVVALVPPDESIVAANLPGLGNLRVSFGVGLPRRLRAAMPELADPAQALALELTEAGVGWPATTAADGSAVPGELLVPLSLGEVVQAFAAVARRQPPLTRLGSDHIVDTYAPPALLAGWTVSRWRGDAFFRVSQPMVRLEVAVRP